MWSARGRDTFQFYATDFAGRSSATQAVNLTIDRTPPAVTITQGTTNSDGSVNVRVGASEVGSGLLDVSYRILRGSSDSTGVWTWAPVDLRLAPPSWGSTTTVLSVSARDRAGNTSAVVSREIVTTNVLPDLLAPESSVNVTGGSINVATDGVFELRIGASDDRSGVAESHYQVDGGEWQTAVPDAAFGNVPVNVYGVGLHTVSFYSVDNVGHVEETKIVTFEVVAPPG